ncbi:MarR family transcriptional regulator [Micromonospora tarapacensis]|uniref:MarR family transcriptional regulator n=1 Tax=Micromonospora tarapacensis TaxID=2835305 RepID=UPI0038B35246
MEDSGREVVVMALVRPENPQQARLVRLLRDDGPRSRVELGDVLGLSRTTLTAELDRLVARGLVETAGPAASAAGAARRCCASPAGSASPAWSSRRTGSPWR